MINILWSHVPVIFHRDIGRDRQDIVQTTASFAHAHRFFSSILLTTLTRFSILLVSQPNKRKFNLYRDREISNILLKTNDSSSFLLIGISRISFSFLWYSGFFDRVLTAWLILWKTLDGILFRWKTVLTILRIDKLLRGNISIYNMKYF